MSDNEVDDVDESKSKMKQDFKNYVDLESGGIYWLILNLSYIYKC